MIWHEQRGLSIPEYNAENLPLSVTTANSTTEYRYDESGNRISKETGEKKELYLRDQTGRELATYICVADGKDSVTTFNLYGNGNIGKIEVKYSWVSKRNSGGGSSEGSSSAGNPGEGLPQELVLSRTDAVYYYVHDYLGSIAATLDNRGEFVFAEQVYPYGEVKQKYEAGTATQQRFDFTGKERDSETGLHYYGARYYDSKLGIWLSVDPLLDKYPGLSPYNYCMNNPINAVDPDGRESILSSPDEENNIASAFNSFCNKLKGLIKTTSSEDDKKENSPTSETVQNIVTAKEGMDKGRKAVITELRTVKTKADNTAMVSSYTAMISSPLLGTPAAAVPLSAATVATGASGVSFTASVAIFALEPTTKNGVDVGMGVVGFGTSKAVSGAVKNLPGSVPGSVKSSLEFNINLGLNYIF